MPWPPPQVSFEPLFQRLLERLRFQIAAGSLTVRRLAREIDVSQPHMQNVVSGKRALTVETGGPPAGVPQNFAVRLGHGAELGGALERVAADAGTDPLRAAAGRTVGARASLSRTRGQRRLDPFAGPFQR